MGLEKKRSGEFPRKPPPEIRIQGEKKTTKPTKHDSGCQAGSGHAYWDRLGQSNRWEDWGSQKEKEWGRGHTAGELRWEGFDLGPLGQEAGIYLLLI